MLQETTQPLNVHRSQGSNNSHHTNHDKLSEPASPVENPDVISGLDVAAAGTKINSSLEKQDTIAESSVSIDKRSQK